MRNDGSGSSVYLFAVEWTVVIECLQSIFRGFVQRLNSECSIVQDNTLLDIHGIREAGIWSLLREVDSPELGDGDLDLGLGLEQFCFPLLEQRLGQLA
jgi:hypothetical protein